MAEASIPVDLFNPGQVFACIGFAEAADELLGGAEGCFDWSTRDQVRFWLRASTDENPIEGVLRFLSEATVMVKVGEVVEHTAAVGAGPVNALDHALRKALEKFYPQLREVKLLDYKVRVLSAEKGTESKVRVLIESGDHKDKWGTVGVSENIMEASWQALADSIEYKLLLADR